MSLVRAFKSATLEESGAPARSPSSYTDTDDNTAGTPGTLGMAEPSSTLNDGPGGPGRFGVN
jgi:hypothetical protein